MMKVPVSFFLLSVLISPMTLQAGQADITHVEVKALSNGLYQFDVTVAHLDEGWEHYVDKWDVVAPDGAILASRSLVSPTENTPTITRSLVGVRVPDGIKGVTLRAHDTLHGDSGKSIYVDLPRLKLSSSP